MGKKNYPPRYSHFGTVCVPVLEADRTVRHHTSVLLRRSEDGRIRVFYYGGDMYLRLEDARKLKSGSADPYIDSRGFFHDSGYNSIQTNGRRKWAV